MLQLVDRAFEDDQLRVVLLVLAQDDLAWLEGERLNLLDHWLEQVYVDRLVRLGDLLKILDDLLGLLGLAPRGFQLDERVNRRAVFVAEAALHKMTLYHLVDRRRQQLDREVLCDLVLNLEADRLQNLLRQAWLV